MMKYFRDIIIEAFDLISSSASQFLNKIQISKIYISSNKNMSLESIVLQLLVLLKIFNI